MPSLWTVFLVIGLVSALWLFVRPFLMRRVIQRREDEQREVEMAERANYSAEDELVGIIKTLAMNDPLEWATKMVKIEYIERDYYNVKQQKSAMRPVWVCKRGGLEITNPQSVVGSVPDGIIIRKDGAALSLRASAVKEVNNIYTRWVGINTDQRVANSRFDELDEETKRKTIESVLNQAASKGGQ